MGLKRIDLHTPLPEIAWAWEGLIPQGFVSVVGALPGEGLALRLPPAPPLRPPRP